MPALSPTMTSGNIVKWLKKEGDKLNVGDAICDIETDKAVMALEVQEEGYLAKILIQEGAQNVKINEILALLVEEESEISSCQIQAKNSQPPIN